MVTASHHTEGFRFRFLQLSLNAASRLRNSIQNIEIESRKPEVILLVLKEDTNLEPLYEFLASEPLDPKSYSVWVSVVSSSDHDGISLPRYIIDLIKKTGCGVDFSFVASLGSDDDKDETESDITHNGT